MEEIRTNGLVCHKPDAINKRFAIQWLNGNQETRREEIQIDSTSALQKILSNISNYNAAYKEYGLSQKLITIE